MAKLPKELARVLVKKLGFDELPLQKKYGNHIHTAIVGGKVCDFDSDGEHKLANYLQLLKEQNYIKDWERESHNFEFPDSSWLVDFTVRNNDDSFEYYEFKGYVGPSTKKKIMMVAKYYPQAQITMVMLNRKGIKKLGKRATCQCKRACTLSELTRGII